MKKINAHTEDRQGSVMALALMVMATLTIVGLMAINDTVMENTIVRNHIQYRRTLYLAEAAVSQANQIIKDFAYDPKPGTHALLTDGANFPWLYDKDPDFNFGDDTDFGDFHAGNFGSFSPSLWSGGGRDACGFLVKYDGVDKLDNQDATLLTHLHQFKVYGRSVGEMRDGAETIIEVGFRERF